MRSLFEDVITGIFLQSGLFIYINGQIYDVMTPVAFSLEAYSVFSNASRTPGAAVNTVGTVTFFFPFFASACSIFTVHSLSWARERCGHPTKQSFGVAP